MYSSAVFTGSTSLHSTFIWTGSSPMNHSWRQKTGGTGLAGGGDCILLRPLVLTYRLIPECYRQTDRETDMPPIAYIPRANLALPCAV